MNNKILLSIAVSVGIAVLFASPVRAKILVDSTGAIILQSGEVLGESSGSGEDGGSGEDDSNDDSDSSGSGSSDDSSEEKQIEEQREAEKQAIEEKREAAKQTAEEKREAAKQAAEKKREEAKQKLEIQKKANKARFLLKQDGRKIRIDARDGQTKIRIENKISDDDDVESEDEDETELEHEIEDEQEIEIEPGVGAENTKLRVLRSKAIVERLRARAITSASLSVNPETNELSITTKRGDVKVVVLPDAAIQNLIANNIVDEIVSEQDDQETEEATVGEEDKDTVRLESEDESPVYKIAGIKRLKFLGILPFESKVDSTVSAETGEVLESKQQLFKRLLSFLSTDVK